MRNILLTLLALATAPSFSGAQEFTDMAQVNILPGWRTESGDHVAAIKITLAPGWVTYWRAPGEVGIPPQFQFSGDDTITDIAVQWPVPEVFEEAGLLSIGYYDEVIVPLTINTNGAAGAINITGELTIGVCDEICIPATFTFDTLLPDTARHDSAIEAAIADTPLTESEANVTDVTCTIDPISDGLRLTADIEMPRTSAFEFVVIEPSDPQVWVSRADVSRDGQNLGATVEMVHPSGGPFAFDRSGVRITVLGNDGYAVDLHGCSAG